MPFIERFDRLKKPKRKQAPPKKNKKIIAKKRSSLLIEEEDLGLSRDVLCYIFSFLSIKDLFLCTIFPLIANSYFSPRYCANLPLLESVDYL